MPFKMKRRRRNGFVVGFYRDDEDKTRPITKSTAELNRKKVIQNPKSFKGVSPKKHTVKTKLDPRWFSGYLPRVPEFKKQHCVAIYKQNEKAPRTIVSKREFDSAEEAEAYLDKKLGEGKKAIWWK